MMVPRRRICEADKDENLLASESNPTFTLVHVRTAGNFHHHRHLLCFNCYFHARQLIDKISQSVCTSRLLTKISFCSFSM
uniref:Uncharacterized protein n=1 Tax=Kalanchoe fedtschenkoi TaxID=63787 RepID=A0A7N0VC55_KALFE